MSKLKVKEVAIRQVQRNYKELVQQINKTGEPLIITGNEKPQFAILSLKAFNQYLNSIVSEIDTIELVKELEEILAKHKK